MTKTNTSDTDRWYIEASIIVDRDADWVDDRVRKVGEYDANNAEDAKQQFHEEYEDEPGFVEIDFDTARIRQLQSEPSQDGNTGE